MLRSSIDLGTNTCLLLVAEWDEKRRTVVRAVADEASVVRLGQGVDRERRLDPEAMARTLECLTEYAEIVRRHGLDPATTVCVATSSARDASNGKAFFEDVRARTGFVFRVISGDDEARLSFEGALLPGMDPARCAVIDIGGGSTEYISSRGGESLDIGSVRFTERFLKSDPVTDQEFWACQDAVDHELRRMVAWRKALPAGVELVAVAGTATTLAAWFLGQEKFDAAAIDEVRLTRGDVHRMVEELKWRSNAERRQLTGVHPMRADVLLAGAMILWRSLEILEFPEARISTRGLRYGALSLT